MSLILLLNTTEPDRPNGSMIRYGTMVRDALTRYASQWTVERLDISPTREWLNRFPRRLRTPIRYMAIACNARRRLPQQRDCVLHLLDGSHAYLLAGLKRLHVPLVITVHDLIPMLCLRGELNGSPSGWIGSRIIAGATRQIARADHLIADSFNTRNDIIRIAGVQPSQVHVVHPAVVSNKKNSSPSNHNQGSPYLFHVAGNNTFYKNRQGVVDVFKRIRQSMPLKLKMAGAPPDGELLAKVRTSGVASDVEFCANLSEEQLSEQYSNATVFLFPSLYEGFGWPPLEAMAQNCAVVCSDTGSLPEIAGNAALTASPTDIVTLTNHCTRVIKEPGLREKMIAAGQENIRRFSLEALAQGLTTAYEKAEVKKNAAKPLWTAATCRRSQGRDSSRPGKAKS